MIVKYTFLASGVVNVLAKVRECLFTGIWWEFNIVLRPFQAEYHGWIQALYWQCAVSKLLGIYKTEFIDNTAFTTLILIVAIPNSLWNNKTHSNCNRIPVFNWKRKRMEKGLSAGLSCLGVLGCCPFSPILIRLCNKWLQIYDWNTRNVILWLTKAVSKSEFLNLFHIGKQFLI